MANRTTRSRVARETLAILEAGGYTAPSGREAFLRAELAAAEEFDVTIVNDDVRRAADELVSLMRTPNPKRD